MTASARRNDSGLAGGFYPLTVMALLRERNRLRRLLRRPGWLLFYLLLGAGILILVLRAPVERGSLAVPAEGVSSGLASFWILISAGLRLWSATSRSPFVLAQADTSLLLPSPISSRQILLFQLVRATAQRLVGQLPFLALWAIVLHQVGYPLARAGLLGFYLFMVLIGLWGDGIHTLGWLALERVPPARSSLARRLVRAFLLAGALLGLWWLGAPIFGSLLAGQFSQAGSLAGGLFERARLFASIPPLSWASALLGAAFGQAPWSVTAVVGCGAIVGILWLAALGLARDYYESLVLQGEQDARLHQAAASWNVDVQGAAVENLGVLRRLRRIRRFPGYGRGAWALFSEQANRWLRLELGSWWLSLLGLGFVGGVLGMVLRGGDASFWIWLVPAVFALVSAPWGYLAEELRRPYIYLIPDTAWRRLVAASLVSALDVFVSYGWLLVVAAGAAAAGLRTVAVGLVLLLGIAWLTQSSLALSSVAVPSWLGRTTRIMFQMFLSVVGLAPGVLVGLAAYGTGGGELMAASLGFVTTLATGAGLFAVAAALFHRAEMAE